MTWDEFADALTERCPDLGRPLIAGAVDALRETDHDPAVLWAEIDRLKPDS